MIHPVPQNVQPWPASAGAQPSLTDGVLRQNRCSLVLSRQVFAIATFDPNGILERCEVGGDRPAFDWTEAIFSAIGFKGLLDAALNHQSFRYAKVSGKNHVAFLVRRRRRYVALLAKPLNSWEDELELRACLRELGTGDLLAMMQSS